MQQSSNRIHVGTGEINVIDRSRISSRRKGYQLGRSQNLRTQIGRGIHQGPVRALRVVRIRVNGDLSLRAWFCLYQTFAHTHAVWASAIPLGKSAARSRAEN